MLDFVEIPACTLVSTLRVNSALCASAVNVFLNRRVAENAETTQRIISNFDTAQKSIESPTNAPSRGLASCLPATTPKSKVAFFLNW